MWGRRKPDITKGALAGLIGGLVASFVMNQFQAVIARMRARQSEAHRHDSEGRHGAQPLKSQDSGEEPATIKAAVAVSEAVLDRELRPEEKDPAGNVMHYLVGVGAGLLYGIVAEKTPVARACSGTLFGSVVWLTADEIAVPALGLSKPPQQYPLSTHVSSLASHLVYGATTELVRRGVRALY